MYSTVTIVLRIVLGSYTNHNNITSRMNHGIIGMYESNMNYEILESSWIASAPREQERESCPRTEPPDRARRYKQPMKDLRTWIQTDERTTNVDSLCPSCYHFFQRTRKQCADPVTTFISTASRICRI